MADVSRVPQFSKRMHNMATTLIGHIAINYFLYNYP